MTMAEGIAIFGACIGGGSTLTAAILRFVPSRNNKKDMVSKEVCEVRHDAIRERIDEFEKNVCKELGSVQSDLRRLFEKMG